MSNQRCRKACAGCLVAGVTIIGACESPPAVETTQPATDHVTGEDHVTDGSAPSYDPYTEPISGTTLSIEMVPTPIDADQVIWVSSTEITWDLFDTFVYGLDQDADTGAASTVTKPSKPYVAMDRGFGHDGFPVISVSFRGAEAFCQWLSAKTGRMYRLPTESEWAAFCATADEQISDLDAVAWHSGNADHSTHPVGSKAATAGLHDLYGNASEWCVGNDGKPVVCGGSFRDAADAVGRHARDQPTAAWNASDPQFPKSVWWLADAGFIGFRVVSDDAPSQEQDQ